MIKEFLSQPPQFPHAHCASLVLHKGEVFCCWYVYPEDECKDAKIVFAKFDHSQKRWKDSVIAFPKIEKSQGNPLLFSFNNNLYLLFVILSGQYWNSASTFISQLQENNEWTEPIKTNLPTGYMIRHRPFIKDDDILLPVYDENKNQSLVLNSTPPFLNFIKVGELDTGPIQGDLLVQNSGDGQEKNQRNNNENFLYVLRGTGNARKVHRAHSMDGGKTFPFIYQTPFHCPLSGVAALTLESDKILLAHNDTSEQRRTPLTLSFSIDTIKSRTQKWDLETNEGEYSYPSLLLDLQGFIHLVYTHNRKKIGHYLFHPDDLMKYWN